MYGTGIQSVDITYRAGKENVSADALSRNPCDSALQHGTAVEDTYVAKIVTSGEISELLQAKPVEPVASESVGDYGEEQLKDPHLREIIEFLDKGTLPDDDILARRIAVQESQFTRVDGILYYVDHKRENLKRVAVPSHLQEQLLRESHKGPSLGRESTMYL